MGAARAGPETMTASGSDPDPPRSRRIHIVGTGPRTGTTLMAEAMVACFRIDRHTDHEDRIFANRPEPGEIFLTKSPKDLLIVRPLLPLDPDLHVICMIRDPRDAICSRHGRDPDRYWAGLRYWKTYLPHWRRVCDHPRLLTVLYEDFVSDPDRTQRRLVESMPFLEITAPFTRYHRVASPSGDSDDALRGVRPISPSSVGRWRDHLPRVKGQLELHGPITDDLVELGYEEDDSWLELLNGVEPDLEPSHWPERFTRAEIRKRKREKYKEIARILLRKVGIDPSRLGAWVRLWMT